MKTLLIFILAFALSFTAFGQTPTYSNFDTNEVERVGTSPTGTRLRKQFGPGDFPVWRPGYGALGGRSTPTENRIGIQQAAIDAGLWSNNATNRGSGKRGRVIFKDGEQYKVAGNTLPLLLTETHPNVILILTNNVEFTSENGGLFTITNADWTGIQQNTIAISYDTGPNLTNIWFENMILNGNTNFVWDATQLQTCWDVTFKNCHFANIGQDALDLQTGGRWNVIDCTFSNVIQNDISLQAVGTAGLNARNFYSYRSIFSSPTAMSIQADGGEGINVIENGRWENVKRAIDMEGGTFVVRGGVINAAAVIATNVNVTGGKLTLNNVYFSGNNGGSAIVTEGVGLVKVYFSDFQNSGNALQTYTTSAAVGRHEFFDNTFLNGASSLAIRGTGPLKVSRNFFNSPEAIRATGDGATRYTELDNNYFFSSVYTDAGGRGWRVMNNHWANEAQLRFLNNEGIDSLIEGNIATNSQFQISGAATFRNNTISNVHWINASVLTFQPPNSVDFLSGNATGTNTSLYHDYFRKYNGTVHPGITYAHGVYSAGLTANVITNNGAAGNLGLQIISTNAQPGEAAANGSIALRTDGSAWIRTNSTWVLLGSGGSGAAGPAGPAATYGTNATFGLGGAAISVPLSNSFCTINTNAAIQIVGLSGVVTGATGTNAQWETLVITNTAATAQSILMDATFNGFDSPSFVTNKASISFLYIPGVGTNAVFRSIK